MAQVPTARVPSRARLTGSLTALAVTAGLGAVMFAFRGHLDDATVALVLVIPVVLGVILGGVVGGTVSVVAGFLLYDFVFIPPYYTLRVGSLRYWLALGVYVAVVSLVARVVDRMRTAEQAARSREADTERLLGLSELLLEDRPIDDLLRLVADAAMKAFSPEAVVLLLPRVEALAGKTTATATGSLEVVAMSGRALTTDELDRVRPAPGVPSALIPPLRAGPADLEGISDIETVVLSAPGEPIGLLVLVGVRLSRHERATAVAFANNVAIAVQRSQLQHQAVRARVLEEVDRLRAALVAAVSHDLRTPLATIKASASALLHLDQDVSPSEHRELLGLIDSQADRLARLVTNLLDMSRIETGALAVDRQPLDVGDVVTAAIGALRPLAASDRIDVVVPRPPPMVDADHVLLGQVLVNLIENALRYAPEGTPVRIESRPGRQGGAQPMIEIAVTDRGPGFPESDRARLLGSEPAARRASAGAPPGGSGVGLAIAKAFAEVQGGEIRAETPLEGGTTMVVSMPAALAAEE